ESPAMDERHHRRAARPGGTIDVQHLARMVAIGLVAHDLDAGSRGIRQQGQVKCLGLVPRRAYVFLPSRADLAQAAGHELRTHRAWRRRPRWLPEERRRLRFRPATPAGPDRKSTRLN